LLAQIGDVNLADLDRATLLRHVGEADILWVRLRTRIDSEVLGAATRLKTIVTPTTGLNHIDLREAERRGIRVLSLKGETSILRNVRATAEHTIALILALSRRLPQAWRHVHEGGWTRDLFVGSEIFRKTAGIVGYGRLGCLVAGYLACFGARVLVCDRPNASLRAPVSIEVVGREELLRLSDIVSVHVDLNPETEGFFGAKEFEQMKPGALFVNTARGELVDEPALLHALRSHRLAGAALDVLSGENPNGMGSHPLVAYAKDHDNLLITPHIGGCTKESMQMTELFLAQKLNDSMAIGLT
jgi:D-3-phosphoglycerate dehydrogenase